MSSVKYSQRYEVEINNSIFELRRSFSFDKQIKGFLQFTINNV